MLERTGGCATGNCPAFGGCVQIRGRGGRAESACLQAAAAPQPGRLARSPGVRGRDWLGSAPEPGQVPRRKAERRRPLTIDTLATPVPEGSSDRSRVKRAFVRVRRSSSTLIGAFCQPRRGILHGPSAREAIPAPWQSGTWAGTGNPTTGDGELRLQRSAGESLRPVPGGLPPPSQRSCWAYQRRPGGLPPRRAVVLAASFARATAPAVHTGRAVRPDPRSGPRRLQACSARPAAGAPSPRRRGRGV